MIHQNIQIITGLTGDVPKVIHTKNGTSMATLSIATTKYWKTNANDETQSKTEWHEVQLFGSNADRAIKYVQKGQLVSVQGESVTLTWEDKQGNKRSKRVCQANSIQWNPIPSVQSYNNNQRPDTDNNNNADDEENDLPF